MITTTSTSSTSSKIRQTNTNNNNKSSSPPNKRRRKRGISNTKLLEQASNGGQKQFQKQPSYIRGKQPTTPSKSISSHPSKNINNNTTTTPVADTSCIIHQTSIQASNKHHPTSLEQQDSKVLPPQLKLLRDHTGSLVCSKQSSTLQPRSRVIIQYRPEMPNKKRGSLILTCSSGGEEETNNSHHIQGIEHCTGTAKKEGFEAKAIVHPSDNIVEKCHHCDDLCSSNENNNNNTSHSLMPQPSSISSPVSEATTPEDVVVSLNTCGLNTTKATSNNHPSTTRSRSNSKTMSLSIKIDDTNISSVVMINSKTTNDPSIVVTPPMPSTPKHDSESQHASSTSFSTNKPSTGILSRLLAVRKNTILINSNSESPTHEPPTRSSSRFRKWKKHARSQSMSHSSSNAASSNVSTSVSSTCGNSSSTVSSFSSSKSVGNSSSREYFSSSRTCSEFDSHGHSSSCLTNSQHSDSPQHHTKCQDLPSSSNQSKKSISQRRSKIHQQKMTEVQASCHPSNSHHAMFQAAPSRETTATVFVEGDDGLDGGVIPSTTTTSPRSTTTSSTTQQTARNYKNVFLNMVDDHITLFLKKNSFRNSHNSSSIMIDASQTSSRKLTLADCPPEILLYIASFVLTTINCCDYPTEKASSPVGIIVGSAFNFSTSSLSPSGFMYDSSSNMSSRSGRHSSTLKRFEYYPKYTMFPKELTRDYFSLMLTCKAFYYALNFDPDIKNEMKNGLIEGFWEYILFWHYVYPNFASIDKMDDFMTDVRLRKPPELSYKRIYQYVNMQVQQIKVQIPKKKNSFDPTNYFYLLVAGVNSLVIQTIRALFYESKSDFECKSIRFDGEEYKVRIESCSFMDYSLAPNCAEYKFRGTDGILFVCYMSSRKSLDAMIKYIEKCIDFRKKDDARTTMDPPAAIIMGNITNNTTIQELTIDDLIEVKNTYSYFIRDVVIVNTDTLENIQTSFEKVATMMYRTKMKSYVNTIPIIEETLRKDEETLTLDIRKGKRRHTQQRCSVM